MEKLKLNISGLDELFGQNITAPSVLALCGGPGTGKTTLALQMAYSLEIISEKNVAEHCIPAFLTFDATSVQLSELAKLYEFSKHYKFPPSVLPKDILTYTLDKEVQFDNGKQSLGDIIENIISKSYPTEGLDQITLSKEEDIVNAMFGLIRKTTRVLRREIENSYVLTGGPGRRGVIILDGLSTILAYVPPMYKRMVLHCIVKELRDWPRLAAAILTFELSNANPHKLDPNEKSYIHLEPENYLADVVFWLMVKGVISGKRRRTLEIIKARQAEFRLGEHSIWIIDPSMLKKLQSIPVRGFKELKPGFVVFPSHKAPPVTSPQKSPPTLVRETTGLSCLDEMFGSVFAEDISPVDRKQMIGGIFKGSTTAILGSAGSGKTLIGLAFALAGLTTDDKGQFEAFAPRIFCSFDVNEKELLSTYGNFRPPKSLWPECLGASENMTLREAWEGHRLRVIYRSPDNFDQNFFFWLLERELNNDIAGIERIVLDGIDNVERISGTDPGFQDFLTNLTGLLKQYEVTALFTYERSVDFTQGLLQTDHISCLADNMIVTAQISINDVNRKCVMVIKSRGQPAVSNPRELIVLTSGIDEHLTCRISDTFDEYSQLLRGRPEPVEIHLRLFGENKKQIEFNTKFVTELRSRYPNICFSTFTKTDLREILWEHRGVSRAQALRSDITVVSVDEPWFHQLVLSQSEVHLTPRESLARLYVHGDRIDSFRKRQLESFLPHVMLASAVRGKFYALPQYYDMGFLFYRADLLEKHQVGLPTTLGQITKMSNNNLEDGSWLSAVAMLSKKEHMFSFAIETNTVGNLVCPFIELCWNYGALPEFLEHSAHDHSRIAVENSLRTLAWLVYHRYMPYPCDNKTTGQAIFCRHWYSSFQEMKLNNLLSKAEYCIMKFPIADISLGQRNILQNSIQNYAMVLGCHPDNIGFDEHTKDDIQNPDDFHEFLKKQYARNFLFEEDGGKWKLRETVLKGGWMCSGGWYTSVLRSGRSVDPGWIIASELVDQTRVIERAYEGAGLPPTEDFYMGNGHRQVPDISPVTFGNLYSEFFPCARHRYDVFGFSEPVKSSLAYELFADELYMVLNEFLSKCVKEMPDEEEISKIAQAIFQKADNALYEVGNML